MKKVIVILSILLIIAAIYAIRVGSIRQGENQKKLVLLAQEDKEKSKIEGARFSTLNAYQKIFEEQDINALIIGDEIGESIGSSDSDKKWFNIIKKDFSEKYKSTITMDLITGSSTTVIRGWVALNNAKQTKKYDLAFICLGQNDQRDIKPEQFIKFYESIIIKLKKMNPSMDIIPIIESSFKDYNKYLDAIKALSKHYNLQYADTIEAFKASGEKHSELSKDGIRPNDKGYSYYATTVENIIHSNYTSNKKTDTKYSVLNASTNKLTNFVYDNSPDLNSGYSFDNGITGDKIGNTLTFNTTNSVAIIQFLKQPNGGRFKVFVDDKLVKEINTNLTYQVSYSNLIFDNLEGPHKIEIIVSAIDKDQTVKILGLATN